MLPDYQTFFSNANLDTFWADVKWLLFFVAPVVMVFFSVYAVRWFIKVVKGGFTEAEKESRRKPSDDDDIDVHYY